MDNKLIITGSIIVLLFAGGYFFVTSNQSPTDETKDVIKNEDKVMVDNDSMMVEEDDKMMKEDDVMEKDDKMMQESEVKEFKVNGGAFYFDKKELTVTEGDTVKIAFTNEGGTHNFVLDEFGVQTPITQTGETIEVEFVADKVGSFEYYCSVANHRQQGMVGTLTVQPK